MQQKIALKLLPSQAANEAEVKHQVAKAAGVKDSEIFGIQILKKSIDARQKKVYINITVNAFINEPFTDAHKPPKLQLQDVSKATKSVIIIGAGPAGLFAALELISLGVKPIIVERGKDVRSRRRDLAALNKKGKINPDSNYCFGEGGAGTYSDGKLYTRSNKRGNIDKVLALFVKFGADEKILYEAHPHIGTNKLPQIIVAMREQIIACGGEVHFDSRLDDFEIENGSVKSIATSNGNQLSADAFILATGHSARDIFYLLQQKKILIEAKPFALGVRVEHPQSLIDSIQYHCALRDEGLPPASYSLVQQVSGAGVFSFCMCPGGIIAPASTAEDEVVVNGWSPSKRNNPFANSGMVVQLEHKALWPLMKAKVKDERDPLLFLKFQQMVEQDAFVAGGGSFVAPAQRLTDFIGGKVSAALPENSYLPGLNSVNLRNMLPAYIHERLAGGFLAFGKRLKGYLTNEAIVVATESRTSSPVRIPRSDDTLQHPQIKNLYPCGEGAGYAGGIVSAAMDGQRVANKIAEILD